jgi:uncharacterized protein YjhX (UPF0386 family)
MATVTSDNCWYHDTGVKISVTLAGFKSFMRDKKVKNPSKTPYDNRHRQMKREDVIGVIQAEH